MTLTKRAPRQILFFMTLLWAGSPAHADSSPGSRAMPRPQPGPDWRVSVREFARQHFRHPAWGYSHSVRIHALALELAAEDGVDLDQDVMFAAALLHDVAAFPPWADPKLDHADEAARIVEGLLAGTGFPMEQIEEVGSAIRTHMYDRDPVGPEARYLHDADALDWLGSIGAARILSLVDANGGPPDGPAAIAMLEANLARVPPRVLTPAGRSRVDARRAELQSFIDSLRRQTDDLRSL